MTNEIIKALRSLKCSPRKAAIGWYGVSRYDKPEKVKGFMDAVKNNNWIIDGMIKKLKNDKT